MRRDVPGSGEPHEPGWVARTFASLEVRNYRRFFTGQAISLVGTWMQSIAQGWLVLELTGSATWVGITIALQTLPMLFLGPYGGLVADRVPKRQLLVATQAASAVLAFVLFGLTASHTVTLDAVLVLALLLGIVNAFDNPTRQAFVREMVHAELVRNAVSLNSVLVNAARAVGPALAGVLIATSGLAVCFLVNGLSYLAVIVAYIGMDGRSLWASPQVERGKRQVREGFAYVWRTAGLRIPLVMMTIVGTLTYEFQVSLPALAKDTFGGGAEAYGWLTASMGVGAVVGGLWSATRSSTGVRTMVLAATTFGLTDLLVALSPTMPVASLALVATGAASVWFLAAGNSTLQLTADPVMRGRVMALWAIAFLGTTPVGGPAIGWVAEHAGPRWALAVGAVAALVAAGYGAHRARLPGVLTPAPEA